MRVPALVSEFFDWRWAPCVGLTAGSLGFVALALLLIPTRFDGSPALSSLPSEPVMLATTTAPPRALFGAALPRDAVASIGRTTAMSPPARPEPAPVSQPAAIIQRGFSPIIDRPEPPAPPPPAPPPLPPPAVVVEAAPPPVPPAPAVAPPPDASPTPAAVVVPQPDPDAPHRE